MDAGRAAGPVGRCGEEGDRVAETLLRTAARQSAIARADSPVARRVARRRAGAHGRLGSLDGARLPFRRRRRLAGAAASVLSRGSGHGPSLGPVGAPLRAGARYRLCADGGVGARGGRARHPGRVREFAAQPHGVGDERVRAAQAGVRAGDARHPPDRRRGVSPVVLRGRGADRDGDSEHHRARRLREGPVASRVAHRLAHRSRCGAPCRAARRALLLHDLELAIDRSPGRVGVDARGHGAGAPARRLTRQSRLAHALHARAPRPAGVHVAGGRHHVLPTPG
jgi:hypothetical protein